MRFHDAFCSFLWFAAESVLAFAVCSAKNWLIRSGWLQARFALELWISCTFASASDFLLFLLAMVPLLLRFLVLQASSPIGFLSRLATVCLLLQFPAVVGFGACNDCSSNFLQAHFRVWKWYRPTQTNTAQAQKVPHPSNPETLNPNPG